MNLEFIKSELNLRVDYYSELKSYLSNLRKSECSPLLADLLGVLKQGDKARIAILELSVFVDDQLEMYQALLECVNNPTEENITHLLLHLDLLTKSASAYFFNQRSNGTPKDPSLERLALNEKTLFQDIKTLFSGKSPSYPYISKLFSHVKRAGNAGLRVDKAGVGEMIGAFGDFFMPPFFDEVHKILMEKKLALASQSSSSKIQKRERVEAEETLETIGESLEGLDGEIFKNIKKLTENINKKIAEMHARQESINVFLREFVTVFYQVWPTLATFKKKVWDEKEFVARKELKFFFYQTNQEVVDTILRRLDDFRVIFAVTKEKFDNYLRNALLDKTMGVDIKSPVFAEINTQKKSCEKNMAALTDKINIKDFSFSDVKNLRKQLEQLPNDCGALLVKLEEKITRYKCSVESIIPPSQEKIVEVISEDFASLALKVEKLEESLTIPQENLDLAQEDDPFKIQTIAWKELVAQRRAEKARRKQACQISGPMWHPEPEIVKDDCIISTLQSLSSKKYERLRKIVFGEPGITFEQAKNIITRCKGAVCEIGNGGSHKKIVLGKHSTLIVSQNDDVKGTIVKPHGKKKKASAGNSSRLSEFNLSQVTKTFHRAGFTEECLLKFEKIRETEQKRDIETKLSNAHPGLY